MLFCELLDILTFDVIYCDVYHVCVLLGVFDAGDISLTLMIISLLYDIAIGN
jgi:hypothetical protein